MGPEGPPEPDADGRAHRLGHDVVVRHRSWWEVDLHELDRLIPRESLKQVQNLQKRLAREYLPA